MLTKIEHVSCLKDYEDSKKQSNGFNIRWRLREKYRRIFSTMSIWNKISNYWRSIVFNILNEN